MKTMTYNLLTYEQAVAICDGVIFYEKVDYVDGFKISTFNYRLAGYNNFVEHQAWEMRGLTFVFNADGTLFKRFLLMNKFFNLNQVEETQLHLVKDIPFKSNYFKEDGSIISFIQLPNGRILAKSKMETTNNQAQWAMECYAKSEAIQNFVKYCTENNLVAVFELVSPKNRIVLKYMATELILLRVRDNNTGMYYDLDQFDHLTVGIKKPENMTAKFSNWQEVIDFASTAQDLEGGVMELVTGQFIKWKTEWYCNLHNLLTDVVGREDYLLQQVLAETIDDLIAEVDPSDTETLDTINDVIAAVQNFMKKTYAQVMYLENQLKVVFKNDRKAWALAHVKTPWFGMAVRYMEGDDIYKLMSEQVEIRSRFLERAREFVSQYKPNPLADLLASLIQSKS